MYSMHFMNYRAISEVFETHYKLWDSKWCIRCTWYNKGHESNRSKPVM